MVAMVIPTPKTIAKPTTDQNATMYHHMRTPLANRYISSSETESEVVR